MPPVCCISLQQLKSAFLKHKIKNKAKTPSVLRFDAPYTMPKRLKQTSTMEVHMDIHVMVADGDLQ